MRTQQIGSWQDRQRELTVAAATSELLDANVIVREEGHFLRLISTAACQHPLQFSSHHFISLNKRAKKQIKEQGMNK